MDIWEADKLVLFIAFVVPGFVSLKTYEVLFPRPQRNTADQLIDAIAYSSVNYALLAVPIFWVEQSGARSSHPVWYALFYVFALLVAPVVWAYALRQLRMTRYLQGYMPHPIAKPWDYVFSRRGEYWIIVTMKDGHQIAGLYGDQSFSSSSPASEQLYLQETWVLNSDGGLERPRADTAGIMILSQDILAVEFFHRTYGGQHDGSQEGE